MLIHYVKQNLLQMFKKEKLLFFLIIFVQIASVIVILFSYGIFNHYNTKVDEVEGVSLHFAMERFENPLQDTDKAKLFFKEILPTIEMKLDYFFLMGPCDDILVQSTHYYNNGKYIESPFLLKGWSDKAKIEGRMFNADELNNGSKVYYAAQKGSENDDIIPEKLVFGDDTYTMIGKHTGYAGDFIFIPLLSLPQEMKLQYISFYLTKPLLESEYEHIKNTAIKYFGDSFTIPEFDGIKNKSDSRVYTSLIYVAVFLIIISIVNYCIVYEYILNKRKKILSVLRICGCKQLQAIFIYMIELLIVSVFMLIIGQVIYTNMLLPKLQYEFEYMKYYYTSDFFIKINVLYIVLLIVSYGKLVFDIVHKTPIETIKEV